MKNIKLILVLFTLFYSCQNKNDVTKKETQKDGNFISSSSDKTLGTVNTTTGEITYLFDETSIREYMIDSINLFTSIDTVELYYNDPASGHNSFLTIIGSNDTATIAVQVILTVSGNDLIMIAPDGEVTEDKIATHYCNPKFCEGCRKTRFMGFVTGCDCKGANPSGGGWCDHNVIKGAKYIETHSKM